MANLTLVQAINLALVQERAEYGAVMQKAHDFYQTLI